MIFLHIRVKINLMLNTQTFFRTGQASKYVQKGIKGMKSVELLSLREKNDVRNINENLKINNGMLE